MIDFMRDRLADLGRRLRNLCARGVVTLVNDGAGRQVIQVSLAGGEIADSVERFQNFGLSSSPPVGSEAVLVAVGGDRSHLVALAAEDRGARPSGLAEGETRVYASSGQSLYFKEDGTAELVTDNASLKFDAEGGIELNGAGGSFSLEPGGACRVQTAQGVAIVMGADGNMDILTPSGKVRINGITFDDHFHMVADTIPTSGPRG